MKKIPDPCQQRVDASPALTADAQGLSAVPGVEAQTQVALCPVAAVSPAHDGLFETGGVLCWPINEQSVSAKMNYNFILCNL